MTSPVDKSERDYWWDLLRKRFKIFPTQYSSKEKFRKALRDRMEIPKHHRAKGTKKRILARLTKSDFWNKSKYEDERGIPVNNKGWRIEEDDLLREMSKSYKGKELVNKYNASDETLHQKRSYWSIMKRRQKIKE
jgi:hypothetical protein